MTTPFKTLKIVNWLIRRFLLPSIVAGAILILIVSIVVVPNFTLAIASEYVGIELLLALVFGAMNAFRRRSELINICQSR